MAIIQDETIVASDFINESEKDATPANDNGRVVKLENTQGEDRKIQSDFLANPEQDVVLGETIDGTTTPKAVVIGTGDTTPTEVTDSPATSGESILWGVLDSKRVIQSFNSGEYNKLSRVNWNVTESGIGGDDDLYVKIYLADGSFHPTGAPLYEETWNSTAYSGFFEPDMDMDKNTDYVIRWTASTTNSGDEYRVLYNNGQPVTGEPFPEVLQYWTGSAYLDIGVNIFAGGFSIEMYDDLEADKVYLAGTENLQRERFDGYVYESGVLDDDVKMLTEKNGAMTGLTPYTNYYVDTLGSISTTISRGFAGKSNSATELIYNTGDLGAVITLAEVVSTSLAVDYTASAVGFVYGKANPSGGSVSFSITTGGVSYSYSIADVTGVSDSFCFPVTKGDTVEITSTDCSADVYFRPFN